MGIRVAGAIALAIVASSFGDLTRAATKAVVSGPAAGAMQLSLPWSADTNGTVYQGCHSWTLDGEADGICSSFDVIPSDGRVLAPVDGVVHRDGACAPAEVRITIGAGSTAGWSISFYHLANIPASLTEGSSVSRGAFIGNLAQSSGAALPCGGGWTGPHTHMTLWPPGFGPLNSGTQGSWVGVDLGGYAISNPTPTANVGKTCFTSLLNATAYCTTYTDAAGTTFHNYGVIGAVSREIVADGSNASWLVGSDLKRRWIKDQRTWSCLVSRGNAWAGVVPDATLSFLPRSVQWAQCPPGDVNTDGTVNIFDLSIFLSHYGQMGDIASDLNFDGVANVIDLSILLSNYGTSG